MGYQRNQISRIYRGTLKTESHEPSCGIIPKTQDHAGDHQFFQKSPGIKFLYDWGRKLFHYWPGMHFQQNYQPGKQPGHISPGHLDRVCRILFALVISKFKPQYTIFYFAISIMQTSWLLFICQSLIFNVYHKTHQCSCFSMLARCADSFIKTTCNITADLSNL